MAKNKNKTTNFLRYFLMYLFAPIGIFVLIMDKKISQKKKIVCGFSMLWVWVIASAVLMNSGGIAHISSWVGGLKQDAYISGDGNLYIHFIDVGQADCILAKLPNGETMLIDAGNNADADTVTGYLKEEEISNIDYLVGTHPHEDHIGGLDKVIDEFEVGDIYLPCKKATTKTFEDMMDAIERKSKKAMPAKSGVEIFKDTEMTIEILSPLKDEYEDVNDYSAVILFTHGANKFLFAADAEETVEDDLIVQYGNYLDVDVLKVGHHGSGSSSSMDFLEALSPEYAVIQVGEGNNYGHPDEDVLERYNRENVQIYRTDLDGNVILTSDGEHISFTTEK